MSNMQDSTNQICFIDMRRDSTDPECGYQPWVAASPMSDTQDGTNK